jgi:hypothetical protein
VKIELSEEEASELAQALYVAMSQDFTRYQKVQKTFCDKVRTAKKEAMKGEVW